MPTELEIIERHAAEIREEIAVEKAKSDAQRLAETVAGEINQIAAQLAPLQKQPTRYHAQIKVLAAQLEAKQSQFDELTGKQNIDWRTRGNHNFTVFPGGKIEG